MQRAGGRSPGWRTIPGVESSSRAPRLVHRLGRVEGDLAVRCHRFVGEDQRGVVVASARDLAVLLARRRLGSAGRGRGSLLRRRLAARRRHGGRWEAQFVA